MTTLNNTKKPFGLSLSVKIALEAIRHNIAPSSVIFSNLFYLKKSTSFPKDLDIHFFSNTKYHASDDEKKVISKLLDSMKMPHTDVPKLVEGIMADGWVKKIPPKYPVASISKKTMAKKKPKKSFNIANNNVVPTIIVKKPKIGQ